jgi:preprotein translocase subunit YajC
VTKVDDAVVVLEIADNTRVRVSRRAIAGFEGEAEPAEAAQ